LAARRYEKEHQPPIDPKDDPFPGVDLPRELISERGNILNGIGFTVLKFAREHRELTDRDVFDAAQALGETYRTLGSGLYYEKPPAAPLPHAVPARSGNHEGSAANYHAVKVQAIGARLTLGTSHAS
jgi:hypothetical protein